MTKSTITREQLEEWVAQFDEDGGCDATDRQLEALIRQSLAALDSEPVAWSNGCNKSVPAALRYLAEKPRTIGGESSFNTAHLYQLAREIEFMAEAPLYRHAQQPVVPDDIKLRELFDSWFASDCSFDRSPEASEEDNIAWRESYWYVWQRCRAAMLQARNSPAHSGLCPEQGGAPPAQDGCSPAQNQGWIPVGERMPEDRTQVILWDAEIGEVTSGHYSHKTQTFYHCGDAIRNEITHWMPPPAAPQEPKP
ncbi:hypothetical protein AB184_30815 [Klebsiella oxytoca]|uniref:DUF551 domain-containing protein n=1 Tax=Klebsiella TaxID=570 RepID=UPI00064A8FB4|nr:MULTISPECIES: DUF551 domain-containing protein [Klebsiella]AKL09395.1 hypothetical protein AB184_30815 [Klebsiella oxytoca]AKL26339.1 hypothetical protein AB181_31130 [Klebsiella oxytoca]APB44164.1 hypothetical protein AGF18_09635 [Klebsiella oxytoca]UTJ44300.1 DUF551 domain-containing protein [Klebsiella grimontii]UTJ44442.1 DUF551 domain-containing protein [Klebsiella grimontii]